MWYVQLDWCKADCAQPYILIPNIINLNDDRTTV